MMRRCLSGLTWSTLLFWCAVACGQSAPPPVPEQTNSPSAGQLAPPAADSPRLPPPLPAAAPVVVPSPSPEMPPPTSAEPAPTDWGSLEHPVIGPLRLPTVNYLLAGPPVGMFQHETGQAYHRPVANPDSLLLDDARLNLPIDLYRPDGLAPIGVLGDHTLKGGGQMLISYRYFVNAFAGNLVGTHSVGLSNVLNQFPIAPRRMIAEKHLVLIEYGMTDDLTMMANLPFPQVTINQATNTGGTVRSSEINPGDIPISALWVLRRWDRAQLHLNFGLSIPVGLIDLLGHPITPTSPDFSYPLRAGSGTWDLLPGLTYRGQNDRWTWGGQALGTVRLGRNRYDYRLGDQVDLTTWLSRRWGQRISTSGRIDYQIVENVTGADVRLNQALVPTNRPDLQAFQRTNLLFGLNVYLPDGRCPGQRFSVEAGFPIFQWVSGPQLGARWTINTGWNMIW